MFWAMRENSCKVVLSLLISSKDLIAGTSLWRSTDVLTRENNYFSFTGHQNNRTVYTVSTPKSEPRNLVLWIGTLLPNINIVTLKFNRREYDILNSYWYRVEMSGGMWYIFLNFLATTIFWNDHENVNLPLKRYIIVNFLTSSRQ